MSRAIAYLVTFIIVFFRPGFLCQAQSAVPIGTGQKVPDIAFSLHIGDSVVVKHLSDFRGKVLLLDFWGTTCHSCVNNMANWAAFQASCC